ncbi:helix-turn-helix transcriptional regulator [Streptomyces sp. TRM66268-LWL]|uniref:Helix-turn-helix transcriptional regulator n=1 Tax=Streptomyces polyasparticus TaxID=2767826 RepID=A0ABR7SG64_9ACTN|nr:helix-turn-helix transcriptional regulator [Streptomyces polyasparticus]MBC9714486.1 helix-turn-helix transcriptional regulator [Streptomyces polyasparticus]
MKSSLEFYGDMPLPVRVITPARLAALRERAGLSKAELARRIGVSTRMVFFYEEGRHTPTPQRLQKMATALHCDVEELTGVRRGEERLVDLRFAAGLTLDRAVELLRRTAIGRELGLSAPRLSALEQGRPVLGRNWRDRDSVGRLPAALAKIYGVPARIVVDAWMRTRPDESAPVRPRHRPQRDSSGSANAAWQSLNERQQVYLGEVLRDERMTETEMWMRRTHHLPVPHPAEWRKLPLALDAPAHVVGYTRLQERLRRRGVHDPGAGATVHALARRGLLVTNTDVVHHHEAGEVTRVRVEMTRLGRAVARAGLGEHTEQQPDMPLLSEWLWGVMTRVAEAGPDGLERDALSGRAPFYLGVGYKNRSAGRPSRGFIDEVPVPAADGSHVIGYRWKLTPIGIRHAAEYLTEYRRRYPQVDTTGIPNLAEEPP